MFGRLLGWYMMYTFSRALAPKEFSPVQNSLYVQVLRSPMLAALLHGTPAVGVSQTLRCGTRNGIMELSQRVPPILGWAAMTLGIGPHSSFVLFLLSFLFFLVFSSPNLSGRRLDVYHTSTHGVELVQTENAGTKCTAHGWLNIQDVKNRHQGTIAQLCRAVSSQLRHVSTIGKKLVKRQYLLHMSS